LPAYPLVFHTSQRVSGKRLRVPAPGSSVEPCHGRHFSDAVGPLTRPRRPLPHQRAAAPKAPKRCASRA